MQCFEQRVLQISYDNLGPWDHPRIQLVELIDCGFALALLEDKQSLAREDCNVPFL